MGEKRKACRLLVGKSEENRPLGRPRRRWVNYMKMGGMAWIGLAHGRDQWRAFVSTVMNLGGSMKWWKILE
jgi:hypothetical protein